MDSSLKHDRYDVVLIGGSLSGASAALLLLRQQPELKVLVIEKSAVFGRRVGEATVEISAWFLGRMLGMTRHLNDAHLVKQGMRFWFANEETQSLADSSEIGGRFQVRLPSYQLDRAVFDTELLRLAEEAGAEVIRPANVTGVTLSSGGEQTVTFKQEGGEHTVRTRWVVDGSGVAAVLSRQEGWWRPNENHRTSAVWARWKGVKDLDGTELAAKYPEWAGACYCIRNTATNHVVGDGWWSWWIPLKGGDTSVGIVMDQRLVEWPREGASLGDRMRSFLSRHPVAKELLEGAEFIPEDVHWRKNLAYSSDRFLGDGFALVGDAAVFIDPLYSPGMDWVAYTAVATVQAILKQQAGEPIADFIDEINRKYTRSYDRWFEAIYRDKYEYVGDFELMSLAFNLDLGLYYLGVVSQPFRHGQDGLLQPPFSTPPSTPVYHLMRTYNRRLAAIARKRRKAGRLGQCNTGRLKLLNGFTFSPSSLRPIFTTLVRWGWLEVKSLFLTAPRDTPAPATSPQPTRT